MAISDRQGESDKLPQIQRRRVERVQILLPFRVTEVKTGRLLGRIQDIHEGGCRLSSPEAFTKDTLLHAVFDLARSVPGSQRLELDIRVRWCRPAETIPAKNFFEMGFQFENATPEIAQVIREFVSHITFLGDWLDQDQERRGREGKPPRAKLLTVAPKAIARPSIPRRR